MMSAADLAECTAMTGAAVSAKRLALKGYPNGAICRVAEAPGALAALAPGPYTGRL